MANNISNNTHKASGQQDWIRIPPSECIPWAIVLTAECLAIVILNIITIIIFVKQREQRRRSTYLIIHLAIVDVLAGAASGPLLIEHRIAEYCHLWKFDFNGNPKLLHLKSVFGFLPVISLINLAVISLERLHATFFPFRHLLVKKQVYIIVITFIWLTIAGIQVPEQLRLISDLNYYILYFSYFVIPLCVILFSYISIFVKVRYGGHTQNHGAVSQRDRKLTHTLFLVTLASLLTWFPVMIYQFLLIFEIQLNLSWQSEFHIEMTWQTIYFANSLINPVIYAQQMPRFRTTLLQLFHRNVSPSYPVELPLRNL